MDPELQSIVGDLAPIPFIMALMVWGYKKILSLVTSGEWVPRSTMDLIIAQNDKLVAAKDKTIASQERQILNLQEGAETTKHAIVSLREAGNPEGDVT